MVKNYYKKGYWQIDEYLEDTALIKDLIPENIRSFITDYKFYSIETKESLHDAWLTSFKYSFKPNGKKEELIMNFLGPYHDFNYQFIFQDVLSIKFKYEDKYLDKDDLIIHLFQIYKDDIYNYDFIFSTGQKITIKFKKLEIIKTPIKK